MSYEIDSNIEDIAKSFKKLTDARVQRRVLTKANRRGTVVIQKKAKMLAPVGETKQGKKQIRIKSLRKINKSIERGHTIIFDTPKGSKLAPYMFFVNSGTKYIRPRLFLEAAFDIAESAATKTIITQFYMETEKELIKIGWKK